MKVQLAMPWGHETRILGARKPPGILYNLLSWCLRVMPCVRVSQEWLAAKCDVSVRTIRRWWAAGKVKWGLDSRQIGPRRWEYFRVKVAALNSQTVLAHVSNTTELEPSQVEESKTVEVSVCQSPAPTTRQLQSAAAIGQIREIAQASKLAFVDCIQASRSAAKQWNLNGFQVSSLLRRAFSRSQRNPASMPRSPGWFSTVINNSVQSLRTNGYVE